MKRKEQDLNWESQNSRYRNTLLRIGEWIFGTEWIAQLSERQKQLQVFSDDISKENTQLKQKNDYIASHAAELESDLRTAREGDFLSLLFTV